MNIRSIINGLKKSDVNASQVNHNEIPNEIPTVIEENSPVSEATSMAPVEQNNNLTISIDNTETLKSLLILAEQSKMIQDMLKWYETERDKEPEIILVDDGKVKINLPTDAKNIQVSVRINEKIWNDFGEMAEKMNPSKTDLLSTALQEFVEKYKHTV